MPDLVLYKKDTCPYCRKVMQFIAQNGITLKKRDILRDPEAADELVRVGGKKQVPCLFIDGKPMYESDDIIAYLKTLAS
ncbi:MAG: glutaredoxin [Atopobiaceae bacterium]|jgi:glutaredoxin|nr:glutaredoxin [Atopobiaceae bacterium]MCH4181140.1 glutaredoxin [Atopobiaceae bacterium]MCH4215015.1 glutaredoxin [Atopobiaceae bacterium]MCH4229876.1 glutaredoxin [Atopobiaceae bacterium]MCH4276997.1 glutaredoxin [Atopobiaceae bacterium]